MSSSFFSVFTFKRTWDGPPSTRISYSRPEPLTPDRGYCRSSSHIRHRDLIPLPFHYPYNPRNSPSTTNHVSMVTRHYSRRHISRTSHTPRPKGTSLRDNSVYYFRSILFRRVFLSFLPLKPGAHS